MAVIKSMLKYKRGQIWFRKNVTSSYHGSVQGGRRPVLIYSSDEGNSTSSVIGVIPITKENKPEIDINVKLGYFEGMKQTALCNQLTTISTTDLDNYMCTVSPDTMRSVDKGVMKAYDLDKYNNNPVSISIEQLESIIGGIIEIKTKELQKKAIDKNNVISSQVIDIVKDKLSDIYDISDDDLKVEDIQSVPEESSDDSDELVIDDKLDKKIKDLARDIMGNSIKESDDKSSSKKRKPKGYWNRERCKEFINDKDSMDIMDVKRKWDIESNATVSQYYYMCRKKLLEFNKKDK